MNLRLSQEVQDEWPWLQQDPEMGTRTWLYSAGNSVSPRGEHGGILATVLSRVFPSMPPGWALISATQLQGNVQVPDPHTGLLFVGCGTPTLDWRAWGKDSLPAFLSPITWGLPPVLSLYLWPMNTQKRPGNPVRRWSFL